MIRSKQDYIRYRHADRVSLGSPRRWAGLITNEIYLFQSKLRKLEYAMNCNRFYLVVLFRRFQYKRMSVKLGFSISPNTFGPGLSIAHRGNIIVNGGAKIGENCRIHVGVNIGTEAGKSSAAPTIGNNCYIGPGAKIFGTIKIGPDTVIGANSVVNKSFPKGSQTIAGVPARVVSSKSSKNLLIEGFKKQVKRK